MPLNEREKRRADFAPEPFSEPVVMRDGQAWYVAKPQVRLLPSDDEIGFERTGALGHPEFDAAFGATFAALERSEAADDGVDPETGKTWVALRFALYRQMLARNYDLTTAELREILWFGSTDGPDEMVQTLMRLSQGLSGKGRSGAGDALSATLAD